MDINLKKLEFDKIINILLEYCVTSKGKELANKLLPNNNHNEVQKSLNETREAVSLMYKNSCPSFYEFQEIDLSIKNLKSGITLSIPAILNLNKILKMAYDLKNYFEGNKNTPLARAYKNEVTNLWLSQFYDFPSFVKKSN